MIFLDHSLSVQKDPRSLYFTRTAVQAIAEQERHPDDESLRSSTGSSSFEDLGLVDLAKSDKVWRRVARKKYTVKDDDWFDFARPPPVEDEEPGEDEVKEVYFARSDLNAQIAEGEGLEEGALAARRNQFEQEPVPGELSDSSRSVGELSADRFHVDKHGKFDGMLNWNRDKDHEHDDDAVAGWREKNDEEAPDGTKKTGPAWTRRDGDDAPDGRGDRPLTAEDLKDGRPLTAEDLKEIALAKERIALEAKQQRVPRTKEERAKAKAERKEKKKEEWLQKKNDEMGQRQRKIETARIADGHFKRDGNYRYGAGTGRGDEMSDPDEILENVLTADSAGGKGEGV